MARKQSVTSMQDVAKLVGLSRATVSDVINNRWREKGITQQTHDRVLEVIREHKFRPNAVARSLAAGRTFTIGVQLPSSYYEHWNRVHGSLDQALRRHGYHMVLANASLFHHDEEDEIRRLCDRQVDGLILSPERGVELGSVFQWIENQSIPFVFLGDAPLPGHYSVLDDNAGQSCLAVEHLIGLGHSRIAFMLGSSKTGGERARRRSYLETMRRHGLPIRRDYLGSGHHDPQRARREMDRILGVPNPPTAVYCAADTMALGAIDAAKARGLRVPDDLAVVGHADDIPFIEHHRTPLTTIRQPREQLAELSAKMLLDLIEGRKPKENYVELPGELIVRDSCGGARREG